MARRPRIALPGQPHHLIQRGNNRTATFFADGDYQYYLDCLTSACKKYDCAIHAYCLMTNHVHLLVTPDTEQGLSRLMQAVGRRYVRTVNQTYHRSGTLWEGRYKSALIDSERYLLTCARYIELNPVRAGMVDQPDAYSWSSYQHNALGKNNALLSTHELYRRLGQTAQAQQTAYRALFQHPLNPQELKTIREATHTDGILGNHRFQEEVAAMVKRRVTPYPHGGDRRSEDFQKTIG